MNKDLKQEREKCTFNTVELTHMLDGGAENTKKRKELERFFLDDPELISAKPLTYMNYQEKYEEILRKLNVVGKKLRCKGKQGMREYRDICGTILDAAIFKTGYPLFVHFEMFIQTIETQGTEAQQNKWLERALECNIIGTYAQTEMGHGTFIRGIQTTATYDHNSEEFILNTPALTSFKWWPGLLGNTCNYAVVLAQLYSLGKCYGVHFFVVQLRDDETHKPLPGIRLGDIGAKCVMTGGNHGFLAFDSVRIPRNSMLMKNSKVLKDGTYVESVNSKLTYGTLIHSRVKVVRITADSIKKSVSVAIRYSAIRRQSQLKPGDPESQILDYVTQQYKLFPQISACLAFTYSAWYLQKLLEEVSLELESGNLDQLPELHALSSCIKAITTADAAVAVETCRFACGGNGYMMCSNFPDTYALTTPMSTFEGENTILLLQTARFLIKQWPKALEGKPSYLTHYANTIKNGKGKPFEKSIAWIICSLEQITGRKIDLAFQNINARVQAGIAPEDTWNFSSIELVETATIYAKTFIVKTFNRMMTTTMVTASKPLKTVLVQVVDLYGVYILFNLQGELLRFTDADGSILNKLQAWLEELLRLIRPNAVGLIDSFDLHDEILSSALGAFDGNVYEKLYKEALKSPLNNEDADKSYELYLKEFMRSKY